MKATQLTGALAALAAFGAVVAACGDEAPAPVAAVARPALPAPTPAAPVAAVAVEGGIAAAQPFQYAYNPMGKRDPFRTFETPKAGPNDDRGPACVDPLCQFDLEQLSLVAVVSGDANPLAMVEDPGTVGHLIRRNARMGKQGGKVTQILRDCIIVTEYWTGPDGKSNPNPVKICVKNDGAQDSPTDLMNPGKSY